MLKAHMRGVATAAALLPVRLKGASHQLVGRCDSMARKCDGRSAATFALLGVMLFAATPAYAQAGGQGDITSFLQNLVNLITGTAGKLIAVAAIAITGIAWMIGGASGRTLGAVIFGCMLIFSAAWIVDTIIGG